jgi:hypothetical protein
MCREGAELFQTGCLAGSRPFEELAAGHLYVASWFNASAILRASSSTQALLTQSWIKMQKDDQLIKRFHR